VLNIFSPKSLFKHFSMEWYNYLACFFSGAFLANTVPHFVHGISGDKFPTPFSKPPGVGLSSALVNMVWALVNLVVGALLFHAGKVCREYTFTWVVFFAGVAAMSMMLSIRFQQKHKE
jgi:hypothetical protein